MPPKFVIGHGHNLSTARASVTAMFGMTKQARTWDE
jgi:hypothetical protein